MYTWPLSLCAMSNYAMSNMALSKSVKYYWKSVPYHNITRGMISDIMYIVDVLMLPPECVWVSTVVVAGSTLLVASLPLVCSLHTFSAQ